MCLCENQGVGDLTCQLGKTGQGDLSGLDQGFKYSIEASSSINTGVETTRSHLAG